MESIILWLTVLIITSPVSFMIMAHGLKKEIRFLELQKEILVVKNIQNSSQLTQLELTWSRFEAKKWVIEKTGQADPVLAGLFRETVHPSSAFRHQAFIIFSIKWFRELLLGDQNVLLSTIAPSLQLILFSRYKSTNLLSMLKTQLP